MILLIQFRNDQSGWHELKCVYSSMGTGYCQIQTVNLYSDHLSLNDLHKLAKGSNGIIIGGLGSLSYGEEEKAKKVKFNEIRNKALYFLHKIMNLKKNPPVLGMCFGHQLIAEVLGSTVKPDMHQAETGTFKIKLTSEALKDPLYKGISSSFY